MKRSVFYSAAFLLPVLLGIGLFIIRKITPFGPYSLTAIDGFGQYFPMLREAERDFFAGRWYSFSGALGFDVLSQSAYYTNSPLWILLYILPGQITVTEVNLMVIFRFGLMGLSFFTYAYSRSDKAPVLKLMLSLFYAFSAYTMAFINQFMWMDAVILLPLVALGIERLYRGKKWLLYPVALALTIWSNFYVAYMVCIFAVIWFFKEMLRAGRDQRFKDVVVRGLIFAACSLAAGLVNLPALYAVYAALKDTLAVAKPAPTAWKWYYPFYENLKRMLPGTGKELVKGAPNLWFGLLTLGFTGVSLFSRKVKLSMKIFFVLLAVFFLISFESNMLDYFWHGFHFPNQLPGRQSFLFIFVMLAAAIPGTEILTDSFLKRKLLQPVAVALLTAELLVNSIVSIAGAPAVTAANTPKYDAEMALLIDTVRPDEDEFFRTEMYKQRDNSGQLYGYYGVSYYSSTMSGDAYDFFIRLGQPIYAKNVSTRYEENPYVNALFGVRYILSDQGEIESPYLRALRTEGRLTLHENTAALPLGFMASEEVLTPIDAQAKGEDFCRAIFRKIAGDETILSGSKAIDGALSAEFSSLIESLSANGLMVSKVEGRKITGTLKADRDGVFVLSLPYKDTRVFVDGEETETAALFGYLTGAFVKKGDHEIVITLDKKALIKAR